MGTCFQSCLRQQIHKNKHIHPDPSESALVLQSPIDEQIIYSQFLFQIQSNSIKKSQLDALLIFTDRPQNVIKDPFISKLGVSQITNLLTKLKDPNGVLKINKELIVVHNPFFNVQIKKLVICEMKVWDGRSFSKQYMKRVIENTIQKLVSSNIKIWLGIMEIQSNLGYNLKDFYIFVMSKLKQYSHKFNGITYFTHKKKELKNLMQQGLPENPQTQSSHHSQKSDYF